ncbi:MAG: hypothetical protein GTO46_15840 [Gemmatimonadetes bacterium]|nr:hypothetical protein [Gemmatimonadota bacterium]NIO33108.1 hypothetical protein [Gemmatimonadota bacterium]
MSAKAPLGYGCFLLFLAPFCGVGIFMTIKGLQAAMAGDWGEAGLSFLFGLAFGAVGIGLLAALFYGRRKQQELERLQGEHPAEPWLWRPDWAAGRIEGSSRAKMYQAWGFALFWNLISYAVAPLAIAEGYLREGEPLVLLVLVFPLVGAGLLIWATRATIRQRKFGVSVFRMASVPGVIGRKLEGVILTNTVVRPDDAFRVTLTCVNRITTGSGKSRSTRENILWQEERRIRLVHQVGRATAVPVAFRLPQDVRQSDTSEPGDQIIWRLEAHAEVPGVDYHARFDVPVFRTPESDIPLPPEEQEAIASRVEAYRQPPDSRIVVRRHRRRTEIYFAPARNPGVAAGITFFFIIWTAITMALPRFGAPIIFPIVFGLFAVLLFFVVFQAWLGSTRVILTPDEAHVSYGPLPRTRRVLADDIDDVTLKIGMQAGNRPYYDIQIVKRDGKKLYSGRSIKDKQEAEWLAEQMREALEL